jgi:hypothetical protein
MSKFLILPWLFLWIIPESEITHLRDGPPNFLEEQILKDNKRAMFNILVDKTIYIFIKYCWFQCEDRPKGAKQEIWDN